MCASKRLGGLIDLVELDFWGRSGDFRIFARAGAAIRTPNSTFSPSLRESASTMGPRRCRSISFCTKLEGTESSAKPSAMVSGLTRVSQARCCGVSGGKLDRY